MKTGVIKGLGLMALLVSSSAMAKDAASGEYRYRYWDERGDRIEQHLDQKGDRLEYRFDTMADRARENGHKKRAVMLERKGDRIDRHLNRKGERVDRHLDRRGEVRNRHMDRHAFQARHRVSHQAGHRR